LGLLSAQHCEAEIDELDDLQPHEPLALGEARVVRVLAAIGKVVGPAEPIDDETHGAALLILVRPASGHGLDGRRVYRRPLRGIQGSTRGASFTRPRRATLVID